MTTPTDYPDRVRALLEAATDGPLTGPDYCRTTNRYVVEDSKSWDIGVFRIKSDAALFAEAPTLARAYLDLHAEVERLTRVLRVEQGDESAAPPGWHTKSDRIVTVWHRGPWSVYRHRPGMWRVFLAGTSGWTGEHRTALEAMEAADRAAGGAA